MNKLKLSGLALGALVISLNSCKPKEKIITEEVHVKVSTEQNIPETYNFTSRFSEGVSSVSYTGQVVRQLLVQDIKTLISNNVASGTPVKAAVLALFNGTGTSGAQTPTSNILTSGSFTPLFTKYTDYSGDKNLVGKTDKSNVISYNKSTETLLGEWLDIIDARIADGKKGVEAYTTEDYIDYNQLINKTLLGAVIYSQGTDNYLDIVLGENNLTPKSDGAAYTTMEHVWDEAFGYFGAARDYASYTDTEIKSTKFKDSNKDGKISFHGEYNFAASINAAKRDLGSANHIPTDFTKEAFNAFLAGRTAISNKRSAAEIKPYARHAAQVWEKAYAATLIHYINDIKKDLDAKDYVNLPVHFSEAKGFLNLLQFGSGSYQLVSTADLTTLHTLLGQKPVTYTGSTTTVRATRITANPKTVAEYKVDLDEANTILRRVYNFNTDNVTNWRPIK